MAVPIVEVGNDAKVTLERACAHLLSLQHRDGWWKGELQTNVTMDAEDMLLREFLGVRRQDESERSAAWIRSQQRADGTWANFHGGPGDLSSTIEAYWALRLVGDPVEDEHMRSAAQFVREQGGLQRARVFTHVWLALFGLWSWERIPALPPEVVLLPSWVPLNIYDFACWARQTIVALSVVIAKRPTHALPFELRELHGSEPWSRREPTSRTGRWLARLDNILRAYERRPLAPLRRLALARAERWIVRRQESDGSWGGIQPPWVYSLIALRLLGYSLEHPLMRRGLEGLEGFMIEQGSERRLEACQSPVWDTALAIVALTDAGLPQDDPPLTRAAQWLLGEEVKVRGDWALARPRLEPGGWAFEFANVNYPDVDDTAEVVLALRRTAPVEPQRAQAAIGRATRWVEGLQSADGGWGAFDADNTNALVRELPFLDFGEVIDAPSADVTAHALEMLGALGLAREPTARTGLRWLLEQQQPDGSWFGRWGINYVYGTGAAVPALVACGVEHSAPSVRRAVAWLVGHQNEDGGWGEDPRSYDDSAWVGRGSSTASQTAWALLALHAAGERGSAARRGIRWLVQAQRVDGSWDEPQYTGTGFPSDYYINYHLYRLTFPIMALGRYSREDMM
ncbi:MAG TPA: squalene--hopene cyclase [Solirubrobacteraceae bacterium]|jgi:squalene-hopene/tetraprenyl-beta-curcumene cyclase